jgi:hypothetical protein
MIKPMTLSLLISSAALAQAQVQLQVNIPLPTITFQAPPPMVVVQPGVQVVQDYDDEVFFVDNFYWHRRDGHWFRTRTHNGGWVMVEERVVPRSIYVVPEGRYRRYHGAAAVTPVGPGGVVGPRGTMVPAPVPVIREERREERREDRREDRHERKEERREEKGHGSDKHHKH